MKLKPLNLYFSIGSFSFCSFYKKRKNFIVSITRFSICYDCPPYAVSGLGFEFLLGSFYVSFTIPYKRPLRIKTWTFYTKKGSKPLPVDKK